MGQHVRSTNQGNSGALASCNLSERLTLAIILIYLTYRRIGPVIVSSFHDHHHVVAQNGLNNKTDETVVPIVVIKCQDSHTKQRPTCL